MDRKENSGSVIKRALVSAMGVALGSWLLDGIVYETNWDLFWVVVALGVISAILKPILVLFALPFVFLTLGLGLLVINALLYMLVGEIVPGFSVDGFGSAFWGALIVSVLNGMFGSWINGRKRKVSFVRSGASGRTARSSRRIRKDDDVIDI